MKYTLRRTLVLAALLIMRFPVQTNAQNATPVNFKIAFIADQGLTRESQEVLTLIKDEGAQAVVHAGDFDYSGRPQHWERQINDILGKNFPYFACTGEDDLDKFFSGNGYQDRLEARLNRLGIPWDGDLGIKSSLHYNGIFFLLTAPGVSGSGHAAYLRDKLAEDTSIWRISVFHKNMRDMQLCNTENATGWRIYEESRKGGAFTVNGQCHVYARTHLLSDMDDQIIASKSDTLRISRDLAQTPDHEGKIFHAISGLGGRSVHGQKRDGKWWAVKYSKDQDATFGALFGTFNYSGNPTLAHFYFKNIDGDVIDDFYVISQVDGNFVLTTKIDGTGSVELNPPGGFYSSGTGVTLTASPATNWQFVGWSGDLSGSANPATITMNSNKNVTAIFEEILPEQFTLIVHIQGSGNVNLDPPGGTYVSGTTVALSATANHGWTFSGWTGDLNSPNTSVSVTMDTDKNLIATFEQNEAPFAVEDEYTVNEDETLIVSAPGVLSNDNDADGDPIVAQLIGGVSYGSLTLNTNGSLTYEPNSNIHGLDSFTYIASDGISQSAEVTALITINPINDIPVALDDNYLVEQNSVLKWPSPGVLANDTDVEGDSLSSVLVNPPLHGNLNLNADGSFSYTPNFNFVGSDNFTYKANDGDAESPTATVAITVISTGTTLWPARFQGIDDGADRAIAIAVNPDGAVYVSGWSFSADNDLDFVTLKYAPNGTPLWIQRFNGEGDEEDRPAAMALDTDGAVYVVGKSLNSMGDFDYIVLKYDTNGNFLWKQRHNGPGNGRDVATALAVNQFGDLYMTGESWSADSGFDYLTLKYDSDGNVLWQQRYNGADNGEDKAAAVGLDPAGNICVTGKSWNSETGFDYVTLKYDSEGTLLWQKRYNGPKNDDDEATAIDSDSEGNVYVTGSSWGLGTDVDYATLKYDTNGEFLWLQRFNGPGDGEDRATALVLDSSDNLYVTGQSWDTEEGLGYTTLRYLPGDGMPRWFQRYDGASADDDKPMDLAVDRTSNICVTGLSDGDYGTLKYDPHGSLIWEQRYNGPQNGFDQATAMVVDNSGNIYVTGGSENPGTAEDFATVKYTPFATSIQEPHSSAKPEMFELEQNYPNPFNPSTTITFSLSHSAHVHLIIFDLLGKKVATLVDGKFRSGRHKIHWDATGLPSGLYFYRIKIKGLTKTRKLILLQ
ncbi:tandem-95 repeat protein [candidate division KSB1 bacterium]|nr:tandem-95 repeat protein [candidate division KSB1 bacterium]NIR72710.1 tandem-95 repeat protein [candidate division KSB1 bacterium]NIS26795.1 tandem-95 repeat protein [candidate division KSB1 bacterium]NIT73589.1 tandem-95 repeat protein [candidate division KSB1 bacterium]NIU27465.1 tandem-95 repeat protein [candidate division KSB1 bacterium]